MSFPFYADLHIHSKYSRACSRDCDLEHLAWWAARKGLTVVGTGDFTHPAWFEHLCESLVPAEPGLFQLRPDLDTEVGRRLPPSCRGSVRFLLSVEIATIYKRGGQTRKVHHLIYAPDFAAARALTRELAKVGNLASDGRPILGLDSRDLLELTLDSGPGCYLVPAHIWTPWFSALGSKSGFDAVADCYGDLAEHIFAVETGLSSDPPMNRRLTGLDGYRLVSNSDAHSPPMLAREATMFGTELDYFAIRRALQTGDRPVGTIEFFPEEGKYHLDGHRKCGLRRHPAQTRAHPDSRCPSCAKPLTLGVLHRVEELADRPEGFQPPDADDFHNLVPLPEIVAEICGVGPKTKTVRGEVDRLLARFGPELGLLLHADTDEVARARSPILAEALRRLRRGEVIRDAGYDGEYGTIRLFESGELTSHVGAPGLFEMTEPPAPAAQQKPKPGHDPSPGTAELRPPGGGSSEGTAPDVAGNQPAPASPGTSPDSTLEGSLLDGLDPDQREAASGTGTPLLIIAGPGTGKTRVLTHRIAYLITESDVAPENCLAITFTRRARAEMSERLAGLVGEPGSRVTVSTFHGLGAAILREQHALAGLDPDFRIVDEAERLTVAEEVAGGTQRARRLLASLADDATGDGCRDGAAGGAVESGGGDDADAGLISRYRETLRARNLVDFDELLGLPLRILSRHPEVAAEYRSRYRWISVDEYQDVDERQYRLLRLLAPAGGELCAIGDPDQAIYGFRGADVGFFLRFEHDYPDARTVHLTRNYRSSAAIVTAALRTIRPQTLVPDRVLTPSAGDGTHDPAPSHIPLHVAADEEAEAAAVARGIDQLLGGSSFHSLDSGRVEGDGPGNLSFSDIAVLYRTDATARPVAGALTRAGIPYQKRSHDRLIDRPGVADIVRELRHQGQLDPAGLRAAAQAAIDLLGALSADERAGEIREAAELLAPLAERSEGKLAAFLTELALGAEVDTWDPRADRVSLLTLHAAKGLEFPVVFLVGCEDRLLPLRRVWREDSGDLAEERRLMFVGMTRARSRLFLSRSTTRRGIGGGPGTGSGRGDSAASPYLSDIGADLLRPGAPGKQGEGDGRDGRDGQGPPRRPRGRQMRLL